MKKTKFRRGDDKKYCIVCGAKRQIRESMEFDGDTGKRLLEYYCVTPNCAMGLHARGISSWDKGYPKCGVIRLGW